MLKECKLTTVDNPFDPFEQFDKWFQFDVEKGYYSCSRLARIAKIEDDFTQIEIEAEIERAIDEIIMYDPLGIYMKVSRELNDDDEEPDEES